MEDMRQDIGELQGKLELYMEQQAEYRHKQELQFEKLLNSVAEIKNEFETYKTVARVFKYIGLTIFALLTFKLGEAASLWHYLGEIIRGN